MSGPRLIETQGGRYIHLGDLIEVIDEVIDALPENARVIPGFNAIRETLVKAMTTRDVVRTNSRWWPF